MKYVVDSRLLLPGDLFFALKGEKNDGHDFLKEVALKGAVGAVVATTYTGPSFGLPLTPVEDPLLRLQELAAKKLLKRPRLVIGVTGSVGKTTTKEFIATLLAGTYRVLKSPGNANSQIGLPLTLLNHMQDEEVLVLEMGMNQKGEIRRLIEIAPPDIAVITPVGLSHAQFFPGGKAEIAAAKAEILQHPKTRFAVVHPSADITHCPCDKVLFGAGEYVLHRTPAGHVVEERGVRSPPFAFPFTASHFCDNALAAIAVCRHLGMTWEAILHQVPFLKTIGKRFEQIERGGVIYINDAYNASPESMRAALANLPRGRRTIAVLGEMKEMGAFARQGHVDVAEEALRTVDHLLCFGTGCLPMVEVFARASKPVDFFTDFAQLQRHLSALVQPGDVVLLKGANSNQLWRLLENTA